MTTTWTVKTSDGLDEKVREAMLKLGYISKGELIRDAVRSFLLEKNIFQILGNLDTIATINESPEQSLKELRKLHLSKEELKKSIEEGRMEVEALLKGVNDLD